MKTVVDILYEEYEDFDKYFKSHNEVSYQITIENHLKKGLLLASASYFESIITNELIVFSTEVSGGNEVLCSFLKNKAISRQYHTYFKWDDNKGANTFFGLLGDTFKEYMKDNIKNNKKLSNSIAAFLSIGDERNRLVHLNYGTYTVPKTITEIYSLYNDAFYFVKVLPDMSKIKNIEGRRMKSLSKSIFFLRRIFHKKFSAMSPDVGGDVAVLHCYGACVLVNS